MSDTIEQIRKDREFRMRVVEPGYVGREVIGVGTLYDPQFVYGRNEDGSILLGDVGGHVDAYSPDKPHGQYLKFWPYEDRLEWVATPAQVPAAPICAIRAPASFGPWGGHVFCASQEFPGRYGAHNRHFIYRMDPKDGVMHMFAEHVRNGPLNDGIAGAGVGHSFGPAGSQWEGRMYSASLMNCTIYETTPDGVCRPFLCLEPSITEGQGPIMPIEVFIAPNWAREYAGEMIVQGKPGLTYADHHDHEKHGFRFIHYHIDRQGKFNPKPIDLFAPIEAQPAPSEFGPLAGDLFYVDEGAVDLFHTTTHDNTLPYTAKIMRVDQQGQHHVFADTIQGASTVIIFEGNRMYTSYFGKSYSTGDYHEPDGTIYEIRYAG